MIRRPPRSTQSRSSAASDVYKRQARSRDPLADPFDDPTDGLGTTLVVLDDDSDDSVVLRTRGQLLALAERHDVRVHTVRHDAGNDVERYSVLLMNGLFGAAYLSLGLATTT